VVEGKERRMGFGEVGWRWKVPPLFIRLPSRMVQKGI